MTQAMAPPPKTKSFRRSIRETAAANPDVLAIAVYALIALFAVVAAYLAIFTVFAPYDDEGTLLVTVRAFADGDVLYRDIYSAYGPFYYEVFGGLFSLTGQAVTTDASRTIVMVIWVGSSLLFGIAAQRLTGRLGVGATGMIAAFAALGVLVNEPMHPHGLCVLLLGAFVVLAVREPSHRSAAGAGAVLAALVLTKVNLGVFAFAAVALAGVWTVGPFYHSRWLRVPVVAGFLLMPLLITARDLSQGWVRELLVLEALCAVAVLTASYPLRPRLSDGDSSLVRWLLTALGGFAAGFAAVLGIILLTGPTPSDVYDGIVTQAVKVRDVLVVPLQFPGAALDWGIASVAAAVLIGRLRSRSGTPGLWPGLLRAGAGLTMLFSIARITPLGLDPTGGNSLVLPMTLAWVAAVPISGVLESAHRRFLRVLLPALAIAETIQVYPVAGSQTGIAAVAFVPVAALCLGDALTELRAWGDSREARAPAHLRAIVSVATLAFATMFALHSILLPMASNAVIYRDQEKLALPGASLLRLPQSTGDTYTGIVALLHRYRCSTFVGYPSINSLYLWSGLSAPKPQLPNAWMEAFDHAQQQRIVNEMHASPRPCVVRSEERAGFYITKPPANLPLVDYISTDFRPVGQSGDFELLIPKATG